MRKAIYILTFTFLFMQISIDAVGGGDELHKIQVEETPFEIEEEKDIYEVVSEEYQELMNSLEYCEDKEEWYRDYLKFLRKYEDEELIDLPETIYDVYEQDEIELFQRVVEAEVGAVGGFNEKVNVACAILNRLNEPKFSYVETLGDIFTPSQFATISNGSYKNVIVSEQTVLACEYAFCIEDTVDGAVFFEGNGSNIHGNYADHVMTDDVGHKFYKIQESEEK